MIGSKCLGCGDEIKEHERFRIVEGGVVHTTCTSHTASGQGTDEPLQRVLPDSQRSKRHGE